MTAALARIAAAIDEKSSISISVQLRGALEYGIATGEIPTGEKLPSVRRMAAALRLSPVTVSNVYAALQERGQIEGRVGSGTYVTERGRPAMQKAGRLAAFERRISELIAAGRELGFSAEDIAFRLTMAPRAEAQGLRVLVLGTFEAATAAYAADLKLLLPEADQAIPWLTSAKTRPPEADLVFCPSTLAADAARIAPALPMVSMVLIPNEATRIALAGIAPDANVLAVSYFDDFLTVLKAGVSRFAPHLSDVIAIPLGSDRLDELLARCDVLIHGTGADDLCNRLRPCQAGIEYRHTPDAQTVRTKLLPQMDIMRAEKRSGGLK